MAANGVLIKRNSFVKRCTHFLLVLITVVCCLSLGGCGEIIDKDNIVIAKVDGKEITRGTLRDYIREFKDDERPIVQYKSDVLRVLLEYVDTEIKNKLANRLHKDGVISVDRDRLKRQYLFDHPEEAIVFEIVNPVEAGFTPAEVVAKKAAIEFSVDELENAEVGISGDFKRDYNRIITAKGEDGLAQVEGENCGGCYQMLTAQTMNELYMAKPVFCKSCGRLIYLAEGRGPTD